MFPLNEIRNKSSNLFCTQTNSYRSRGGSESVSNHSDELLYKPSEEEVFDPAQTTAAPLYFLPPRQHPPTYHPIAGSRSYSGDHMFLRIFL